MKLELRQLYYSVPDNVIIKITGIVESPNDKGEEIVSSYKAKVMAGGRNVFGEKEISFTPESKFNTKLAEIITLLDKLKKKVIRLIYARN